jgi:hypothetical protein
MIRAHIALKFCIFLIRIGGGGFSTNSSVISVHFGSSAGRTVNGLDVKIFPLLLLLLLFTGEGVGGRVDLGGELLLFTFFGSC